MNGSALVNELCALRITSEFPIAIPLLSLSSNDENDLKSFNTSPRLIVSLLRSTLSIACDAHAFCTT